MAAASMRQLGGVLAGLMVLALLALVLWRPMERRRSDGPEPSKASAQGVDPAVAPDPPAGSRIRGRVMSAEGPVAGAKLTAHRFVDLKQRICPWRGCLEAIVDCAADETTQALVDWMIELERATAAVAKTRSRADGTFELEDVPAGALTVWAEGQSGIAIQSGVRAGDDVELSLLAGARLKGKVSDERLQGIAGASVAVIDRLEGLVFFGKTNDAGAFDLGPLLPTADVVLAWDGAHEPSHEHLERPNIAVQRVVLRDRRAIRGRVESHGLGVGDATVTLLGTHRAESVISGADGSFEFPGRWGANYHVAARKGDLGGEAEIADIWDDPPPIVIDLSQWGTIEGTVVSDKGAPIADAQVELRGYDPAHKWSVASDAAGHYRVQVQPDRWTLTARRKRRGGDTRQSVVQAGRTEIIDLKIDDVPTSNGIVVDESGRPIGGAELWVGYEIDSERFLELRTGVDGTFEAELTVLPLKLEFRHPQHRTAFLDLTPPATGLRIVLRAGARISGVVLDGDNRLVPGASVVATPVPAEPDPPKVVKTRSSGRFEFTGLASKRHLVEAHLKRGESWLYAKAEVLPSRSDVVLRFEKGSAISGHVVDTKGHPVGYQRVHALPSDDADVDMRPYVIHERGYASGERLSAVSDAEGYFVFVGASRPSYDIAIDGDRFAAESVVVAKPGAADVRLVVVRLTTVHGRVVDPSGRPITEFKVDGFADFSPQPGGFEAVLGADFVSPLVITAPGYAHQIKEVDPSRGDVDLGDVILEVGRTINGRVVDARSGQPIGGAQIWYGPSLEKRFPRRVLEQTTISDPEGHFTLLHVPSRSAPISVVKHPYEIARLAIPADESAPTIRLSN